MSFDIWSDIPCPWCFIGKARFEKALAAFPHRDDVEVAHRSFEVDPRLRHTRSTTDTAHAAKYGMTPAQARAAEENLARVAEDEGLTYLVDHRDHGNTFDLHRLRHLAAARGRQHALLNLFYEGNFASGRSIYDVGHQVELAVRAGLDEAEVRAVLADRQAYADEVRDDEAEAARLGVTGVPFFVVDGKYGVSGAQPVEVFAQVLERARRDHAPRPTLVATADQAGCDADGSCAVPSDTGSVG
ncbi:DsbA family oxidoreductase [Streptomyces sp. NPDC102351]|uniref:DsbA family oxidoreductase n=1 Tax=Streptomyces sp. NPDC102351 TaxID=3366158 RepID=UPI0037FCCB45